MTVNVRINLQLLLAIGVAVCFIAGVRPAVCAPATRLVVWGLESGEDTKGQDAKIAAFERLHPDIQVSALSMGAGAMNPQKLMTAIVGGVPPDVVRQDRFTIGDWASRGAFRPLDDLLQADARSAIPYAIRASDYVPATWAETEYQGHTFAIPEETDDRVLYYNKAMFRAAGLNPDRPPQTWDEMMSDAKRLTIRDGATFRQVGFIPIYGQGWLYLWSWQMDGEVMSADGRRCTLDNPQTAKTLTKIVQWFDELGGVDAIDSFSGGFGGDAQDPFMTGKLAMRVDGDGFLTLIAEYHPELDFGICAVPVPADRLHHLGRYKNDPTWVTWSGGSSYVIPRGAKHVAQAWEFIQWMNSPQAQVLGARVQQQWTQNQGHLFIPHMLANLPANKAVIAAIAPTLPPKFLRAKYFVESLLKYTKFRPVTLVGQKLWDEQIRAVDQAIRHEKTPDEALAFGQTRVQSELDRAYAVNSYPVLPTRAIALGVAGIIIAGLVALGMYLRLWRQRSGRWAQSEARAGVVFASPWIAGFVVLTLFPIIASLVLAFCDYDVLHAPRWVGLQNFHDMVTLDRGLMVTSLGNAVYLSAIGIPLGMGTGLALAMMVNMKIRGLQFYRTFFYMPSIVPAVASAVLWTWILNSDPHQGLINMVWQATITQFLHIAPPGWLSVPQWSKPGLVLMGIWGAGGTMILWLAGLQAIPKTLYEAASIDGANPARQFYHVTLPMLSPYIFFNLIIGIIGALQTFESAYILGGTSTGQSTGPDDSLLVPVVYLFNNAFQYFRMGYASAIAWVLFVIIMGLTLAQLKLAPRWVHYETEAK